MSWGRLEPGSRSCSPEANSNRSSQTTSTRIAFWPNRPLTSRPSTASSTSTPPEPCKLAYDAARKAAVALLAVQGLRSTTKGGHIAVQDAVVAQFGGFAGMKTAFARLGLMRRRRHAAEYRTESTPPVTRPDAHTVAKDARVVVSAAEPWDPRRHSASFRGLETALYAVP